MIEWVFDYMRSRISGIYRSIFVTGTPQPTMRQERAKAYKRLIELYSRTFGFRQPYQALVLVDSSFCTHCA